MKKKPIADDYGDAPKMIQRQIIDPLTDKETEELQQQLKIVLFFVDRRIRLPDGLSLELETFEKRFFATADQGMLVNLVDEAHRNGYTKGESRSEPTAWDVAGGVLGMAGKTVSNQYDKINKALDNGGLPPLANSPKRKAKKNN